MKFELVVPYRGSAHDKPGRLTCFDPSLTPKELQARAERDDPIWSRKPRFVPLTLAREVLYMIEGDWMRFEQ